MQTEEYATQIAIVPCKLQIFHSLSIHQRILVLWNHQAEDLYVMKMFVMSGCALIAFCVPPAFSQANAGYDALVQKGKVQLQAGNAGQALTLGKQAIESAPSRWEAYTLTGGALMNLKRYEEAADDFSNAIERAPASKQGGLRDLRKQCILAEAGAMPAPPAGIQSSALPPATTATQAEIVLWESIKNSGSQGDFQGYLKQYPNGAFAVLAQEHLTRIVADDSAGGDAARVSAYMRECDSGKMTSCTNLGTYYRMGWGVTQDLSKAIDLYKKGCNGGDDNGCGQLSLIEAR